MKCLIYFIKEFTVHFFQTVKPHVKMITFRYGANGANAAVGAATTQTPGNTDITSTQTPGNIGIKSTPVTQIHYDSNVPPRYRRLPMSEEEMEYITVRLHSVGARLFSLR